MIIISHRGYWIKNDEKNTQLAFHRSFSLGFGVEIDIRDLDGQLVISHDPASRECMKLDAFLQIYLEYPSRPTLALNIKADGLQTELHRQLTMSGIVNYFVFDMAVPDGILYLRSGMNTYTRQSEYEPIPPYYAKAHGVWLDEFYEHWLSDEVIENHIAAGKAVCLVSPELHKRPYASEWAHYRQLEESLGKDVLMLCTDFPMHAKEFFND